MVKKTKIIAYSDNICPFCYIGAKRIEKLKKEFNLEIEWRSFEIHPETPADGLDFDKIFPASDFEAKKNQLEYFGSDVGINMNNTRLSNSRLSLQVGEFAKSQGKFEVFQQEVFCVYFEEGKDIGRKDVLLEIAGKIGLNKAALITYLNSSEAEKSVKDSSRRAIDSGITGVPTFIIEDEAVVGAQPTDTLRMIILRHMETDGNI